MARRRAAFAVVYERELPAIAAYLRRRLGDGVAEDATAEVFIRAFRAFERFDEHAGPVLPWLYGFASNVVREHKRAERHRLRALERLAAQRQGVMGADHVIETDPRVVAGLRRLSFVDRETLLLVAWGDLNYAEVAAALGIPEGTVASRIARVRRQLDDDASLQSLRRDHRSTTGEAHV